MPLGFVHMEKKIWQEKPLFGTKILLHVYEALSKFPNASSIRQFSFNYQSLVCSSQIIEQADWKKRMFVCCLISLWVTKFSIGKGSFSWRPIKKKEILSQYTFPVFVSYQLQNKTPRISFQNEILSEEETRRKVRHAVSLITFGLCLASLLLLLVALGIFSFFK